MSENSSVNRVKVVFLGAQSVGKSSIILRFCKNEFNAFNESTIGAAFLTFDFFFTLSSSENDKSSSKNHRIIFDLWDTAGQERYESIAPMYYRGSGAAVVVYDITQGKSLLRAKKWVKVLKRDLPDAIILLCGNKKDMEDKRVVDNSEVEEFVKENGLLWVESSAKDGNNVGEIFTQLAQKLIHSNRKGNDGMDIVEFSDDDEKILSAKRRRKCCALSTTENHIPSTEVNSSK